MLTWVRSAAVRLSFAFLALLLGLFAPAYAGPTSPAPAVEVQPATPDDQRPLVTQVYLLAYRAHGPPSGAFIFVVVHASRLSAGTSYDANGNTVRSSQGADTYTTEDRIRTRTRPDGTVVSIAYDGDGVKVSETVGGVTTWFLVDQQNPTGYSQTIEEIMNGAVVRSYLWGQALAPLAQTGAEGVRYFGTDGHGSVRYLTDAMGTVTDTMDHDAYGVQVGRTGTTDCRYGYSGYESIPALDVHYLRARMYNADTGRFGTMDTWEGKADWPETLHKYQYLGASPLSAIDPSGHMLVLTLLGNQLLRTAPIWTPIAAFAGVRGRVVVAQIQNWYQIIRGLSSTNAATYQSLVAQAQTLYPRLANLVAQDHHIIPQYLVRHLASRGIQIPSNIAQIMVRLPASYHNMITQEIAKEFPYGAANVFTKNPATLNDVLRVLGNVYTKFPLP